MLARITLISLLVSTGSAQSAPQEVEIVRFDCSEVASLKVEPGQFFVRMQAPSKSAKFSSAEKVQQAACMAVTAVSAIEKNSAPWLNDVKIVIYSGPSEAPLDAFAQTGVLEAEPTLAVTAQWAELATLEQLTWTWGHELSHATKNDPGHKNWLRAGAIFAATMSIGALAGAAISKRVRRGAIITAIGAAVVGGALYQRAQCGDAQKGELVADVYGAEVLKQLGHSREGANKTAELALSRLEQGNPPQKEGKLGCLTPGTRAHPTVAARVANLKAH